MQLAYKTDYLKETRRKQRVAKWLLDNFEVGPSLGGKKEDYLFRSTRRISLYREELGEEKHSDKLLESELGKTGTIHIWQDCSCRLQ